MLDGVDEMSGIGGSPGCRFSNPWVDRADTVLDPDLRSTRAGASHNNTTNLRGARQAADTIQ